MLEGKWDQLNCEKDKVDPDSADFVTKKWVFAYCSQFIEKSE